MIIDIGPSSNVTVRDITEFAQNCYKGNHFCSLLARVEWCILDGLEYSFLYFEPCEYRPPLADNRTIDLVPNLVKCFSMPDERPCVFEHFLQSVRKKHQGIAPNFIRLQFSINWQRVWVDFN